MRIYGNRQLKTFPGQLTRPTLARVREALFNIWQGEISGCRWLDLCAGSGSMGAEALCRGAKLVIGIEQNRTACKIIQQNWQMVATAEQSFQVIQGEVLHKIANLAGEQFDRIYFDPPYGSALYEKVLKAIIEYNLLSFEGELAVEHDPKQWKAVSFSNLKMSREKMYGNTALTFYFKSANAEYPD